MQDDIFDKSHISKCKIMQFLCNFIFDMIKKDYQTNWHKKNPLLGCELNEKNIIYPVLLIFTYEYMYAHNKYRKYLQVDIIHI